MSVQSASGSRSRSAPAMGRIAVPIAGVVLIAAMLADTTYVHHGSQTAETLATEIFSPERFGASEFPKIKSFVEDHAVTAATLADAVAADKSAAAQKYGVSAGVGAVIPVTFEGTVGEGKLGIYEVEVPGVPDGTTIRVQTGPAINGTDLRDATGEIKFGQFKNQIQYQNAGAALNDVVKKDVLSPIDTSDLSGKTVAVTGVFKLINPKNWLVTPVAMSVE